jgi:CubicO group peptidase (beta-lactamase class C family)
VLGSAIPRGELAEIVSAARERTGVPGVAAGLLAGDEVELAAAGVCVLGGDEAVTPDTPFRIASVTKWFTASLAAGSLDLDAPVAAVAPARRLLSHTAGLRCDSPTPLPEAAQGLWSYSNAGYQLAGEACAAACGTTYSEALRSRILEPLVLDSTGFDDPAGAAAGHVQEGESGHRRAPEAAYSVERRPVGGLWSTVGDLLRFAAHQLGGPGPLSDRERAALHEPQARALGAEYALGCWTRQLVGGRPALDHEGSVGGFQSLLLAVPEDRVVLAVLTNSWRGSGLIRRVVAHLGLEPSTRLVVGAEETAAEPGRYALDGAEAQIEALGGTLRVAEAETDPLTGVRIERAPYLVDALGGGVYGFAGGLLMSHRVDVPRPGIARVGWVALPRAVA